MADYSTVEEVESLTKRYTSSGSFGDSTNPTATEVEVFLTWLSAAINILLASKGFAVPVTSTIVKPLLDGIVTGYAKDLVEAANSAGRFYTDKNLRGGNPFTVINLELAKWVDLNAKGIDESGADRTMTLIGGILYKGENDDGIEIEPLFQRDHFGNELNM